MSAALLTGAVVAMVIVSAVVTLLILAHTAPLTPGDVSALDVLDGVS